MKRFLLCTLIFTFTSASFTQTDGFSRWSITPEYGYNKFDGDVKESPINILPASLRNITYGLTVEYAMTPVWGLALDYYTFPLRGSSKTEIIETDMYTSSLSATINLTRLVFPQTKSKFYLNGAIGVGLAYCTYNPTDPITGLPSAKRITDGFGVTATVPVTFSVEYNISKPVAIGAKVHYRSFTTDYLEGTTLQEGVTNDFVAAGTVFLRYKMNATEKKHVRNIPLNVFESNEELKLIKKLRKELNKLKHRVDTLEAQVSDTRKLDGVLPRVAKLENILSNDGPDSDGDGVPDVRDLSPNTPPNTPVDFWGRSIAIICTHPTKDTVAEVSKKDIISRDDVPAVYFDLNKSNLNNDALVTINKIATRMQANPSISLEVRGYSDFPGGDRHNKLLSQRRANRVKKELVKVWGISPDRIITNGTGKISEPKTKHRINRRCEFFFGKM